MLNTRNEIDWKLVEMRRTKWDGNDDPSKEDPLTYAAHASMLRMIDALGELLERRPSVQDIKELKISDKSDGEISFEWYGPVFELDLDITADGQISCLLCKPLSEREDWISLTDASTDKVIDALETFHPAGR